MEIGDPVLVRFTKWGGGGHWELPGLLLGSDGFGSWVGLAPGDPMTRLGHEVRLAYARVLAFAADEVGFVASFNERIDGVEAARSGTYVDITTHPVWGLTPSGQPEVSMVDLDLDVVQVWSGVVSVADEEEFSAHQVSLGYPEDIVAHAVQWRDKVLNMMHAGESPFDGRASHWLDQLAVLARKR